VLNKVGADVVAAVVAVLAVLVVGVDVLLEIAELMSA